MHMHIPFVTSRGMNPYLRRRSATAASVAALVLTALTTVTLGGPAQAADSWQYLNGTWTNGSNGAGTTSSPIGANPMMVNDLGSADADVRVATTASSGEAIYLRVQDEANWLRVRLSRSQQQLYYTEREYTWTYTAYELGVREYLWQNRILQYKYQKQLYNWTSYSVWSTTGCQANPPSVPADSEGVQYRLGSSSATGCASGKRKYNIERRTRYENGVVTEWVNYNASPPAGYSATGDYKMANVGATYWATWSSGNGPSESPLQLDTRIQPGSTSWTYTNSTPTYPTVLTGKTEPRTITNAWWTVQQKNATPQFADLCAWAQANFTVTACAPTGLTRQAPDGFANSYDLVVEKSQGGSITELDRWDVGDAPVAGFRAAAWGSIVDFYVGSGEGTWVGAVEEGDLIDQGKHGCGLGGSGTVEPANSIGGCSQMTQAEGPSSGRPCSAWTTSWAADGYVYARGWVACDSRRIVAALAISAQVVLDDKSNDDSDSVDYSDMNGSTCWPEPGQRIYTCRSNAVAKLPNPPGNQTFHVSPNRVGGVRYVINIGQDSGGTYSVERNCGPGKGDISCPWQSDGF